MQRLENKACLKQYLSRKEMQQTPSWSITENHFLDKPGDFHKAQLGLAVKTAVRAGDGQPWGLVNAWTGGTMWAKAAGLPGALSPSRGRWPMLHAAVAWVSQMAGSSAFLPSPCLAPASLPASIWKLRFHIVRLKEDCKRNDGRCRGLEALTKAVNLVQAWQEVESCGQTKMKGAESRQWRLLGN